MSLGCEIILSICLINQELLPHYHLQHLKTLKDYKTMYKKNISRIIQLFVVNFYLINNLNAQSIENNELIKDCRLMLPWLVETLRPMAQCPHLTICESNTSI
jgi:hypothetical protein